MKKIKLSGRERAVLRSIDFATGTSGEDIVTRTNMELEDLVDILNGLMAVGYVEVLPFAETTTAKALSAAMFEVNPSYALDLREALFSS